MEETKYVCPMHPDIIRTMPGMCSVCGMTLVVESLKVPSQKSNAIDKHVGHHTDSQVYGQAANQLIRKLWVVLVFTIPILVYSEIFEIAFKWQPPQFMWVQYVILAFGSFVFFYGGSVVLL